MSKLETLIQQLESYPGVFIIDAASDGHGFYSLKIETPRGVYLDTATAEEWLTLVKDDLHHSQRPWHCPFCHRRLTDSESALDIICPGFSAQGWLIHVYPSNVPQMIYEQFFATWSPAQAYQALSRKNPPFILQETPHGREFLWIDPPSLNTMPDADEWPRTVVATPDSSSSCDLPVYLAMDEADSADSLPETLDALQTSLASSSDLSPYQLPTCLTCRHILTVPGSSFDLPKYFCQYPLTHLEPLIERDMVGYAPIDLGRHSIGQLAENQLHNLILDHALNPFPVITDEFEGYVTELNRFHGPICPRYAENPEALELDELTKIPLTMTMTFNVINAAKKRDKKSPERAQTLLAPTIDRLTALKRDPNTPMMTRITKTNLASPEAQSVVAFMREHIPRDLVLSPYVHHLKRFFHVSNAAWQDIIASLRDH